MSTLLTKLLGVLSPTRARVKKEPKQSISPLHCSKSEQKEQSGGRGEGLADRCDKKIQVAPIIPTVYKKFLEEESERTGDPEGVIIAENIEEALYFLEAEYSIYLVDSFTLRYENTYLCMHPADRTYKLKRHCYGATARAFTRLSSLQYANLKAFALAADVSVSRAASILLQIGLRDLDLMYRKDESFDLGYERYGNRSLQSRLLKPR